MSKPLDLVGKTFGRILVTSRVANDPRGGTRWNTVCQCGTAKIQIGAYLVSGRIKSCGCYKADMKNKKKARDVRREDKVNAAREAAITQIKTEMERLHARLLELEKAPN